MTVDLGDQRDLARVIHGDQPDVKVVPVVAVVDAFGEGADNRIFVEAAAVRGHLPGPPGLLQLPADSSAGRSPWCALEVLSGS